MKQGIRAVGLTGSYRRMKDRIEKRFGKKYAVGDPKTLDELTRMRDMCKELESKPIYIPYNRVAIEKNHRESISRIDDSISMPNEGRKAFINKQIGIVDNADSEVAIDIDYSKKVCTIKNGCIPVEDSDGRLVIDLEKDINEDGEEFRSMEILVAV